MMKSVGMTWRMTISMIFVSRTPSKTRSIPSLQFHSFLESHMSRLVTNRLSLIINSSPSLQVNTCLLCMVRSNMIMWWLMRVLSWPHALAFIPSHFDNFNLKLNLANCTFHIDNHSDHMTPFRVLKASQAQSMSTTSSLRLLSANFLCASSTVALSLWQLPGHAGCPLSTNLSYLSSTIMCCGPISYLWIALISPAIPISMPIITKMIIYFPSSKFRVIIIVCWLKWSPASARRPPLPTWFDHKQNI